LDYGAGKLKYRNCVPTVLQLCESQGQQFKMIAMRIQHEAVRIALKEAMAHRFDFDVKNRIIRCRVDGIVTDESLRKFYRACAAHGALNPTYFGLVDTTDVIFIAISPQTIRELAQLPPAIPDPNIPRCIVAGSHEMFGLARMFDLHGSDTRPNLHVVRTEQEAFAILGITNPHFEERDSE
jgi:hypothetical protein